MNTNVTKIDLCEDSNVGGWFARAHLADGQERDIPLEDWQAGDDDEIREAVSCDALVGSVTNDCPVGR